MFKEVETKLEQNLMQFEKTEKILLEKQDDIEKLDKNLNTFMENLNKRMSRLRQSINEPPRLDLDALEQKRVRKSWVYNSD